MVFWRLRCHYCAARSPHSKRSGVTKFQCATCEAVNFLDGRGNIVDTPVSVAAPPTRTESALTSFQSSARSQSPPTEPLQKPAFCSTCQRNQHVYLETLSNYLPDEDHPRYQEFEDALPKFKAELEQRYPQICRKCAPAAQSKIRQADYDATTYNNARLVKATQDRRDGSVLGRRDDWKKQSVRLLLMLAKLAVYANMFLQIAWHVFAALQVNLSTSVSDSAEDGHEQYSPTLTPQSCVRQFVSLKVDPKCYRQLGEWVPYTVILALGLLWYDPGLTRWYHPTTRIEAVRGQRQYLWMQILLLVVRGVVWLKLSDPAIAKSLTTHQLTALHVLMVVFMLLVQQASERSIEHVVWRFRSKVTPKLNDKDIFANSAGPESIRHTSLASSLPPTQLLAQKSLSPFPISRLASRGSDYKLAMSSLNIPPSPPSTESTVDDADLMDIDSEPSSTTGTRRSLRLSAKFVPGQVQQVTQGPARPSGWSAVRNEALNIAESAKYHLGRSNEHSHQQTRLRYQPPVEQSPFRGRLPQAPMSMERRLRNPPSQFSFKKTPVSKQEDFMAQMRNSIQDGGTFRTATSLRPRQGLSHATDVDVDDFSPAKMRTRGNLELRQSTWQLRTDGQESTGLEDLLGGKSFTLQDEPQISPAKEKPDGRLMPTVSFRIGLSMGLLSLVFICGSVRPIRRFVCLWLLEKMEDFGY